MEKEIKENIKIPYRKFIKQINGINFYTEKIYYKNVTITNKEKE